MAPRAPFRRNRSDGFDVVLEAGEAAVLTRLCEELTTLLSIDEGEEPEAADPVLDRLFPRAYLDPTEEDAESDWQRLVHGDLLDGRRRALATVEGTLAAAELRRNRFELTLSEEQALDWLAVLNDARLALGTRLEVTEDLDLSGLDPDDPDTAPFAVYWWLGVLEERLIDALSA
ncbi:MAG: hypothetical protein QOD57_4344 [Actinomycetota bacterium]|nr:hypothetical protein [Actinomycetota bacterium]MDQ1506617.1 hypothetical protein [Actinomycetota bacterium]